MPEIQDASQFGTRLAVRGMVTSLLGIGGMFLAAWRLPIVDGWTIAGGAVFLIAMIVSAAWSIRPGRFRCPKCGMRILAPTQLVGPLQYHCVACDVIWDTGVKQWTGGD